MVSENLVSEKSLGFKEFGLGKRSRYRFQKIWPRKKVSVSVLENLVGLFFSKRGGEGLI